MSFRKILCPTDFSESAHEALRTAVELAREWKASLTLFHAWDISGIAIASEAPMYVGLYTDIPAAAERTLSEWKRDAEKLGAPDVSTRLASGSAWDQVAQAARRDHFDLIVVGTHGRTGLKHALIGSVAEKIVRHAPCPVLVIPHRAA